MKKLYVKYFYNTPAFKELMESVNENNIPQEAIVSIIQNGSNYTLFFTTN